MGICGDAFVVMLDVTVFASIPTTFYNLQRISELEGAVYSVLHGILHISKHIASGNADCLCTYHLQSFLSWMNLFETVLRTFEIVFPAIGRKIAASYDISANDIRRCVASITTLPPPSAPESPFSSR